MFRKKKSKKAHDLVEHISSVIDKNTAGFVVGFINDDDTDAVICAANGTMPSIGISFTHALNKLISNDPKLRLVILPAILSVIHQHAPELIVNVEDFIKNKIELVKNGDKK